MFQIVFNEISAAEVSRLGILEQLDLFDAFKVTEKDLDHLGDERFGRIWDFYLCYCEAGFAERALGDVQMVMTREG